MPADRPSVPVSTRSISTWLASCCALILPGSFGRRRLREGDVGDELRVGLGVGLHRALGELQLAGDVDHVERDRRGRQRRCGGGPGAVMPVPNAASPAAPRSKLRRLVMILRMVVSPGRYGFGGPWGLGSVAWDVTLLSLTSQSGEISFGSFRPLTEFPSARQRAARLNRPVRLPCSATVPEEE